MTQLCKTEGCQKLFCGRGLQTVDGEIFYFCIEHLRNFLSTCSKCDTCGKYFTNSSNCESCILGYRGLNRTCLSQKQRDDENYFTRKYMSKKRNTSY